MPNHVQNTFLYISDKKKFKDIATSDKDATGELQVDFNVLIPVSAELTDTSATSFSNLADNLGEKVRKIIKECVDNGLSQQEAVNTIKERYPELWKECNLLEGNNIRGYYNITKYGYPSWYEFQINKWGTKWNAYDQLVSEDLSTVEFNTAWSTPDSWLKELAKNIDFILAYADEDIGSNCGLVVAKNGKCSFIDFRIAFNIDISIVWSYIVRGYNIMDEIEYEEENKDKDKEYMKQLERCIPIEKQLVEYYNRLTLLPFSVYDIYKIGNSTLLQVA